MDIGKEEETEKMLGEIGRREMIRLIDGKELAKAGFPYIGTPYDKMDCQKFVERCLEDCGWKIDLAGSNAWYRKCKKEGWVGTPEECVKKYGTTPGGAFLFIHAFDGGEEKRGYHDGLGNASHIGLCTGGSGEGAIHSSSSRGCVAESKYRNKTIQNGGWNMVGLLPKEINYHTGDQPEPSPGPEPEPGPDPEPERETARVWSANGKPVNTRKGPDESYGQSLAGKIPVGNLVEILRRETNKQGEEWCRISWQDQKKAQWYCWMKAEFLKPAEEPAPESKLYIIHIPYVTEYKARELIRQYPGAWMTEGGEDGAVG